MGKKKDTKSGLMSSAGLMRYYDADETTFHMDPKYVVAAGLLMGIAVLSLNVIYGYWP
ncbi:MAG: preprotein translocase subunit Sec61beta [Methanosarcinales archaeon]|nr:preprotein translocase subunit Sec61beta [Methanosarcinales archaeon]